MTAKNVLLADDDTRLKGVECSAENSPSSRPPSKSTQLLSSSSHILALLLNSEWNDDVISKKSQIRFPIWKKSCSEL